MENTKTPEEIVEEITKYFTGNGGCCFTYVTTEDCLKVLKQALNIDGVSKCCTEKDMDNAYDKGFKDGNKRDLTGSLIEAL